MTDSPADSDSPKTMSERLDTLFAVLADEHRRRVVRYFQSAEDDVASVDDLIDYTAKEEKSGLTRDQLIQTFHHVTLPKLADQGVVEYDNRSQTVRYRGPPVLERMLTDITKSDLPTG